MFRIQYLFVFMVTLISHEKLFEAFETKESSDHLSLLAIKSEITPEDSLSSWNASLHFCKWDGVQCGRKHRRVTSLDLSSSGLAGSLSPFIGNLSFLSVIKLQNNTLKGIIPPEIGRLFRLEQLILHNNSFQGTIPATLSNCTKLSHISLGSNKLHGAILQQVSSLLTLKYLSIHFNNFTGGIPPAIGNLTSLETISADINQFGGSIPYSIGQLKSLNFMGFHSNQLQGTIPPSFYNLSSLTIIDIGENQFVGTLPRDIDLKLPKLQYLEIYSNNFTGLLPVSISNWTELEVLEVSSNRFHGKIAIDFGRMQNLWIIGLESNFLGSEEPDEMNFIASLTNCSNLQLFTLSDNQVRGQIPSCVGNLSTNLALLALGENSIYGFIPPSMMNLVNLESLYLHHNQIMGTIPRNLGNLQKLEILVLEENSLSGIIPQSIGNLSLLNKLSLANNILEGTIPTSFGNCQKLIFLNMSSNNLTGSIPRELLGLSSISILLNIARNHLSGSLPREIGKLHQLSELDLSENELSGDVPGSIGGCTSLENLQLEGNFFQGSIPSSFGSLTAIQYLDLSRNNFSGQIPIFLEKFSLFNLNLSFNDFEGELPMSGVFINATAISVAGNNRLCGSLPELQLPKCNIEEGKKEKWMSLVLVIVIPVICVLLSLALVSSWFYIWKKRGIRTQSSGAGFRQPFTKYSYENLLKATNGFSPESLIGVGSYSCVYKGVLDEDGTTVVVKVLNLDLQGASKSFIAECEAWRNIRHRNLVKIITVCSSVDFQGNDFKAIVYEYMPNGSLESWLHPTLGIQNKEKELHGLSLHHRISIATDVAHAIDYLHLQSEIPLIHCDLKPSNILLDRDMVAHVGDFGLARFLLPKVSSVNQSHSIGLRGTIGYAPPEYGLGSEMSVEGDVYSFGISLLEMMTGKRPTDDMFKNGLNLHNYARTAWPDNIINIADPTLVNENDNALVQKRPWIALILGLRQRL